MLILKSFILYTETTQTLVVALHGMTFGFEASQKLYILRRMVAFVPPSEDKAELL